MRIPVVPSFRFAGFSGHRRIADPERVLSLLSGELEKLNRQAGAQLVGIASAAIGGDQLFLRACREQGIPFQVLLPFPEEEFRKDFEPADWEAAQDFMKAALTVRAGEMKGSRPEAYLACGVQTVDECDVLIVVWNGAAAAGVGGTKDIVDYARSLQRPLIWIHSETFEVKTENLGEKPFADEATQSMRKVLDPPGQEKEIPDIDPRAAVQRLMDKADDYATRSAPVARTLAATIILLNLAVVGIGPVGALVALRHSPWSSRIGAGLNLLTFALLIVVFAVAASNMAKVRQRYWLTCRFVAEVCRSVLATWELPVQPTFVLSGGPSEFGHLLRSVYFLRSLGHKQPEAGDGRARDGYIKERIDGQIDYYSRTSKGLRPRETRLRMVSLAAMAGSAIVMAALLLQHWIPGEAFLSRLLKQLLAFLPLVATSALSLIYVYEFQRRLVHNQRMIRLLTGLRTQVLTAPTAGTLEAHVSHCEHALLGEVQDWYYYNLYGK